ncbi:MAG TPA: ATP-binding protein [Candidatus Moranbacteria bacterium]|nr:ATP-binding protein [Candidatus Moranbacteria bacterium]
MNYYAFTSLFNGAVVLAISFYLFFRQRQNDLYQSCAIFAMCIGLWCIFYAVWQMQHSYHEALTYIRLAMIPCYAIPFAFLWFALKLTNTSYHSWQPAALLAILLFFMFFSFNPLMIRSVEPVTGFNFWPRPGVLMNLYVSLFFLIILLGYWFLWQAYRNARDTRRWQIRWVMLSLLPGWLGGATNWCLWYGIPVPPVAHIFVGVGFLLLFYAIVRGRLFDVDVLADLVQEAKLSALGIMATSINHEVRNPLFVIKGLAETLLERDDADRAKVKDIAQRTLAQADRALEIIKNFSEYAKRQSSKTFDKAPLDLREILEGIVPFVRSELALDKITLILTIPTGTTIQADRHSVEEIFLNLIVNACQAMPGGGEIKITAKTGDPGLGTSPSFFSKPRATSPCLSGRQADERVPVIVTIQDNGPGIPAEQLTHIFEPFYTTKSSGTGLGLYVVRQLIEKNRGRIEAQSTQGVGATFTIYFSRGATKQL